MNNEKLDKVYKDAFEKYREYYKQNQWNGEDVAYYLKKNRIDFEEYNYEEFVEKCKTDQRFNEKWGLKIEERELSDVERVKLFFDKFAKEGLSKILNGKIQKYDIPTKLLTITYNNETIEVYE